MPTSPFWLGVRDAFGPPVPIIFSTMLGFGSFAQALGYGHLEAVLSSVLVWALPGQVVMSDLWASGAGWVTILAAGSLASLRFLPMATALVASFKDGTKSRLWLFWVAHTMSANTWPFGMAAAKRFEPRGRLLYYTAISGTSLSFGALGTAIGYQAANVVPPDIALALVFMNPLFLGIAFAAVREPAFLISILVAVVAGPILHLLDPDLGLVATGVLAGTAGFLLGRRRSS